MKTFFKKKSKGLSTLEYILITAGVTLTLIAAFPDLKSKLLTTIENLYKASLQAEDYSDIRPPSTPGNGGGGGPDPDPDPEPEPEPEPGPAPVGEEGSWGNPTQIIYTEFDDGTLKEKIIPAHDTNQYLEIIYNPTTTGYRFEMEDGSGNTHWINISPSFVPSGSRPSGQNGSVSTQYQSGYALLYIQTYSYLNFPTLKVYINKTIKRMQVEIRWPGISYPYIYTMLYPNNTSTATIRESYTWQWHISYPSSIDSHPTKITYDPRDSELRQFIVLPNGLDIEIRYEPSDDKYRIKADSSSASLDAEIDGNKVSVSKSNLTTSTTKSGTAIEIDVESSSATMNIYLDKATKKLTITYEKNPSPNFQSIFSIGESDLENMTYVNDTDDYAWSIVSP